MFTPALMPSITSWADQEAIGVRTSSATTPAAQKYERRIVIPPHLSRRTDTPCRDGWMGRSIGAQTLNLAAASASVKVQTVRAPAALPYGTQCRDSRPAAPGILHFAAGMFCISMTGDRLPPEIATGAVHRFLYSRQARIAGEGC